MPEHKKILVIPSIREHSFHKFLSEWDGDWDELILIEDNPEKTFNVAHYRNIHHFSWKEIDETLGEHSWIISRRDSAIRCFGFLMAYRMGADYVLTLDDDCYPCLDTIDITPIFDGHIQKMQGHRKWIPSVPGMRTRGLPYMKLGRLDRVVANMGFWTRIPDFDSIQSLNDVEAATGGDFYPPLGSRIIPQGQYFPICGMNLCMHRDVLPLSYFPLMGERYPYRRFDDIWFGVIFKKIIDHLGWHISVGEPFVEHQRASDIFVNLVKESPGIAANETFWEKIDIIKLESNDPRGCVLDIGKHLKENEIDYHKTLGEALIIWSSLF